MQRSSGWGLATALALMLLGGVLLISNVGGASTAPGLLAVIARFYSEELAGKFAGVDVSSPEVRKAVDELYERVYYKLKEYASAPPVGKGSQPLDYKILDDIADVVETTKELFNAYGEVAEMLANAPSEETELLARYKLRDRLYSLIRVTPKGIRINDYVAELERADDDIDKLIDEVGIGAGWLSTLRRRLGGIQFSIEAFYQFTLVLDSDCLFMTGTRCTLLVSRLKEEKGPEALETRAADITLATLFSEFSAIVRKLGVQLSRPTSVRTIVVDNIRVRIAAAADPALADAVRAWADAVAKLKSNNWPYSEDDVKVFEAVVAGEYAWLRIGAFLGNEASMEKAGSTYTVRVYFRLADVNSLWSELVRKYVPEAKVTTLPNGVEVRVATQTDLVKVAKLLALLPGLGFVIDEYGKEGAMKKVDEEIMKLNIL